MSWGHPSDERLARWAEDGTGQRAASHAVGCPFCERRLEAITELAPHIRAQLAATLEPSSTFEERLQERLNQRLFDQETLAVLTDLVDVGPETARLLLGLDERDEDHG
ncbi:hypothetical protein [Micromonospora sp. NPDC047740]|uniref:hypothetical protein n=1 Tax=Micromonospora sp. NPDC047740 TaxID=3364254 RepID=UPI00371B621E